VALFHGYGGAGRCAPVRRHRRGDKSGRAGWRALYLTLGREDLSRRREGAKPDKEETDWEYEEKISRQDAKDAKEDKDSERSEQLDG